MPREIIAKTAPLKQHANHRDLPLPARGTRAMGGADRAQARSAEHGPGEGILIVLLSESGGHGMVM